MTSVVTAPEPPLGSKENPHAFKKGQKDRIKGHYYLKNDQLKYWDGKKLRNKEKDKKYNQYYKRKKKEKLKKYYKEYREKNKDKIKKNRKEYYEKNKEKMKEYREKLKKYYKEYRENNKEKMKEWRENNQDKIKKNKKEYYEKNQDKIKECSKEYRENNKVKIKEYKKHHFEENKEKINEYRRTYVKERRKNDPVFNLRVNMSSRLHLALRGQNAYKNETTFEYISCRVKYLYHYIELQFESWMTWNNWGVYDPNGPRTWQIDHRKPCASFDLNDEEQVYMCWHWTNLQPLCSKENTINKKDKFDPETFRYKWWGKEIGWLGIPKYLMPNTSL